MDYTLSEIFPKEVFIPPKNKNIIPNLLRGIWINLYRYFQYSSIEKSIYRLTGSHNISQEVKCRITQHEFTCKIIDRQYLPQTDHFTLVTHGVVPSIFKITKNLASVTKINVKLSSVTCFTPSLHIKTLHHT